MDSKYGVCSRCDSELIPVWFKEEERKVKNGRMHKTGRKRTACSHLECPSCWKRECIDDTFDGAWY